MPAALEKNLNYMKWVVLSLVITFPALAIVVHSAANACLFLLLACALVAAGFGMKPLDISLSTFLRRYWPLHLAMAAWLISVLLNQASLGSFTVKHYDRALRIAVFAPVMWILLLLPFRYLKSLQWTAMAGLTGATVKAYIATSGGADRPTNIGFLSTIAYSDIALLLGILVFLSLGWEERRRPSMVMLKSAALVAGIYTTALTATRGSWLAILAAIALIFLNSDSVSLRRKLVIAFSGLLLVGAIFSTSNGPHRLNEAVAEVSNYQKGTDMDTSVGMRLQMWHGAWLLFQERPLFGIGKDNYGLGMERLAKAGIVSEAAAHYAHSHNELLFNLTIGGVVGCLATLAIYLAPAFYFFRDRRHPDRQIRTSALMGIMVCVCYFLFGLTDLMFFWTGIGSFYTLCTALLLASIVRRKHENASEAPQGRGQALPHADHAASSQAPLTQRICQEPLPGWTAVEPSPAQRGWHRPIRCALPS